MKNIRLIARLDIKGKNLIKGIHLEGLRVIGDPNKYAADYYVQGIDELILMDSVASLYGRNHLSEIICAAAKDIFVPITVGGGIRTVDNVYEVLRSGADKVAINTAAVQRPELITEITRNFGSQCLVLSVEAKKVGNHTWEVLTNNGRERTGLDVIEWIKKGASMGAGEILMTSVDAEGTRKGFDLDLLQLTNSSVNVPVIASGGMGTIEHLLKAIKNGGVDAVAIADVLHYKRLTIPQIRKELQDNKIAVREYE